MILKGGSLFLIRVRIIKTYLKVNNENNQFELNENSISVVVLCVLDLMS